ncbi:MAG: hypothetical protein WC551_11155 [Patescibacteria group bacterium]
MTLQVFGIILSAVLGFSASLLSGMVLFNLNAMKSRIDKLETGQQKLIERKNMCNQDYVGKVEYIRSSNGLEEGMKDLISAVGELRGTMEVIKQMPAICGNIAKEIVREMKTS